MRYEITAVGSSTVINTVEVASTLDELTALTPNVAWKPEPGFIARKAPHPEPQAPSADEIRRMMTYRVIAERERRLALGFDYNFGDVRGTHRIGTTEADLKGWSEVSDYADALLALGDTTTTINIVTDTGATQLTAPEWMAIKLAAAAFRQPIWAKSFVLMEQNPIPQDYSSDSYWT